MSGSFFLSSPTLYSSFYWTSRLICRILQSRLWCGLFICQMANIFEHWLVILIDRNSNISSELSTPKNRIFASQIYSNFSPLIDWFFFCPNTHTSSFRSSCITRTKPKGSNSEFYCIGSAFPDWVSVNKLLCFLFHFRFCNHNFFHFCVWECTPCMQLCCVVG